MSDDVEIENDPAVEPQPTETEELSEPTSPTSDPAEGDVDDTFEAPSFEFDYGDDVLNEDMRSLLVPLSEDKPCGESDVDAESVIAQIEANIEPVFDAIKADFSGVVENDDMSSFDPQLSGSEAYKLNEQAFDCLRDNCKSVILCSQLPKLLMISHGLVGFRAGLDVFRVMIEGYGKRLFPQDKERASQYFRGGVYIGNDDNVTETFRQFLFVAITANKKLPYALLRNSRLIKANPSMETRYANDASNSSPEFYVKLIDEIAAAIEACNLANEATSQFIDDDSVQPQIISFQFVKSLEKMKAIVTNLATEHCIGYPPVEEDNEDETDVENGSDSTDKVKVAQGEIVNREQAVEMLNKIADFFHRTERHSPISYSIRKLIDWTQMDLPELINELLDGDSGPLNEFQKRTGVKPPADESDTF